MFSIFQCRTLQIRFSQFVIKKPFNPRHIRDPLRVSNYLSFTIPEMQMKTTCLERIWNQWPNLDMLLKCIFFFKIGSLFFTETWNYMTPLIDQANSILWHWKTFPISLPSPIESKIEPQHGMQSFYWYNIITEQKSTGCPVSMSVLDIHYTH